jgi:4-hydroxy-2-oxoheptanedioate aldolase
MTQTIKNIWNKPLVNAWISSPSAWNVEIIASSGYDILTIDAQHGLANDLQTMLPMLQAIKGTSAIPFVRLPGNDAACIMRMLDAGVQGLICPMLDTATETEAFVKASKYFPDGNRSIGPTRANVVYGDNYMATANQTTVTLAMIETPTALKNVNEIAKVENLDGFYVGPWDLSMSLGYKNLADFKDQSFLDILKNILDVAKKNKLHCGIHAGNPENGRIFAQMGFDLVTIFNDSSALKSVSKSTFANFHKDQDPLKQNITNY